jgi:hypothetical protein
MVATFESECRQLTTDNNRSLQRPLLHLPVLAVADGPCYLYQLMVGPDATSGGRPGNLCPTPQVGAS